MAVETRNQSRELSATQEKLLRLASYIHSICEDSGIWYSLAAGSVLGAVRHGGFIPWDSDLDIFVRITDLARFREAIMSTLPSEFRYYAWDREPNYHPAFDRLAYKGVSHYEVHVDIFPLIGVPEEPRKRDLFIKLCFLSYQFFRCKRFDPPTLENICLMFQLSHDCSFLRQPS
jgi:lipopolysaccharide cholinephosphotransferase